MTKIPSAAKAFLLKIQTLYDIEKQLEKALPKMAKLATNPDLVEGFKMHLEETKGHSERLEKIFELLDASPRKHASEAIRGLIADSSLIIETDTSDALRDAMLAGAARAVEHYEMACYEGAIEEAKTLAIGDAVILLSEILNDEEKTDKILAVAMKANLKLAAAEEEK